MASFLLTMALIITSLATPSVTPINVTDVTEELFQLGLAANGTQNHSDLYPGGTSATNPNLFGGEDVLKKSGNEMEIPKSFESFVVTFFYPIILPLGVFCSITTIITLKKKALRSSASVYITGMTAANFIYLTNSIILNLNMHDVISTHQSWKNFYSYYVAYISAFRFVAVAANVWTVIAFAIERLIVIFYPLKTYAVSTQCQAKKVVICIFVVAMLAQISRFFMRTVKIQTDPATNETVHVWEYTEFGLNPQNTKIEYLLYAVTVFMIPVPLLGVLNIVLLLKLRQLQRKRQDLKEGHLDSDENKNVHVERVLIASLTAFLICHVVLASAVTTVAFSGFGIFRQKVFDFEMRRIIGSMLYALNPSLNFFLYVCCSKILRNAVKDLFLMRKF